MFRSVNFCQVVQSFCLVYPAYFEKNQYLFFYNDVILVFVRVLESYATDILRFRVKICYFPQNPHGTFGVDQ